MNQDMKEIIKKEIDDIKNILIEMSDRIHENPEIGHQEYKAMEILTTALKEKGFEVKKGIAGMETSFIATLKGQGEGPIIGLLCEYDALIGLGHACGHNLLGVGSVGAAIALSKVMPKINGTLKVFGTPAEEGGVDNAGGKCLMVDYFKETDASLIWHPGSKNFVSRSSSMAREAIQFEFYGKSSHAGGSPWEGNNALNAMIIFFRCVDALRQHVKPDVRLHGFIEKGGVAANIVPDHTIAKFYVRARDIKYMSVVSEKVKNCAKAAALATDCEVKYWDYANTYENKIPNNVLADVVEENLGTLGRKVDRVPTGVGGGSTDVGNVSQVTPIVSLSLSIVDKPTPGHSIKFREAAKSGKAHESLILASKTLAMTAIDLFIKPDLIPRIRSEWETAIESTA